MHSRDCSPYHIFFPHSELSSRHPIRPCLSFCLLLATSYAPCDLLPFHPTLPIGNIISSMGAPTVRAASWPIRCRESTVLRVMLSLPLYAENSRNGCFNTSGSHGSLPVNDKASHKSCLCSKLFVITESCSPPFVLATHRYLLYIV